MTTQTIYEGRRLPNGEVAVEVLGPSERFPLPHVVRHSPTGYEWGYMGSGPSDLALSIVCHHLRLRGRGTWARELVTIEGRVLAVEPPYHRVKQQLIAQIPSTARQWQITSGQVQAILDQAGYQVGELTLAWRDEPETQPCGHQHAPAEPCHACDVVEP